MGADREPYDLLVVGAGFAGSVTALRAATLGCSVGLVDAADDPSCGGNTALSGGSLHVGTLPMTSPATVLRARIEAATGGAADPDLADALAANSGRALAWILWNGIDVELPTPDVSWKTVLAPVRTQDDVYGWRERGPQVSLRTLQSKLQAAGGDVRPGVRVRELVRDRSGRMVGARAENESIMARHVMLADGGFQSSPELRRRFLGPAADKLFVRGAASGSGDGLLMGESVGAQLVNAEAFYGRCLHRDAATNDRLWPMPFLDDLLAYGIVVDKSGKRVVDEARGGIAAANALARLEDPLGAAIVIDDQSWQASYGRSGYSGSGGVGQPAANPEIEKRGGVVYRSADVRELANMAAIDPAGLAATIDTYSEAAKSRTLEQLPVARTSTAPPLDGLLLALPAIPAITLTMGGLLTDARGRVVDVDGNPIDGLYAAGGTASGIQGSLAGGPACSYVGGLALAHVFGFLAAEDVAARCP